MLKYDCENRGEYVLHEWMHTSLNINNDLFDKGDNVKHFQCFLYKEKCNMQAHELST